MSISLSRSSAAATPETPWLGLRPFTEDTQEYFFGRQEELDDLTDRILGRPLTILFGTSGLGKSSLIQAALMPRLRAEGFLPVHVRFDHDETAPPLEAQLLDALARALAEGGFPAQARAASAIRDGTMDLTAALWLLFHDPWQGFAAPIEGVQPRPVVLIDQFEEIFTIGERPARREVNTSMRETLATLIESRPPMPLRAYLEADEELADRIDYRVQPLRVLLSLREDFLHVLERWRRSMPSLMENRLELRMLSGPQALEAVVQPGQRRGGQPAIIPDEVGRAIVRFVAGVADDVPLEEIDAVPPLLSLVCAELNAQRLARGEAQITRNQFEGHSDDILKNFYERSFDPASYGVLLANVVNDEPALRGLRQLIEDRLLSPDGFRESIAFDTIRRDLSRVVSAETSRLVLDAIIERRLLTVEERGGVRRLELAHDVLTRVVKASRDERQENEAVAKAQKEKEDAEKETCRIRAERNKLRSLVSLAVSLACVAFALAVAALVALHQAREATSREKKATILEEQAKAKAAEGIESRFRGLKAIYDGYNSEAIDNLPGLTVDQADALRVVMRKQLLTQLEKLHQERVDHRSSVLHILHLLLDDITYDRSKKDWLTARTCLAEADNLCASLPNPTQDEAETEGELLMWHPLITYLTADHSLACEQGREMIIRLRSMEQTYPKSSRLQYAECRLENMMLKDDAPSSSFLDLARKLESLVESSHRDYDVSLWAFIINTNAYFNESDWKKMPLSELSRLISLFNQLFLGDANYSSTQIENAVDRLDNVLTHTAQTLIPSGNKSDLEERRRILQSIKDLLHKLELRLPRSRALYTQQGNFINLELQCQTAGLAIRDASEIALALKENRERAVAAGIVDSIRDTLVDGFQTYSAPNSDEPTKDHALQQIKDALKDSVQLGLAGMNTLFDSNAVTSVTDKLTKMDEGEKIYPVCLTLVNMYIDNFSKAEPTDRQNYLSAFSGRTETLVERWVKAKEFTRVAEFCIGSLDISTKTDGDRSGLVSEGSEAAIAFVKIGKAAKGKNVYEQIKVLSESILKDRPWDWYVRECLPDFYFGMADALEEAGETSDLEFLRRAGWRSYARMEGVDIDLNKFKLLPKRGGIPEGATAEDVKFFTLAKPEAEGGSYMQSFNIPCDVDGIKTPVPFFISHGVNGYQGLLDQFQWLKEYRKIDVPVDVKESLKKLHDIAVENNVNFLELCNYALKYPTDSEKKDRSELPAPPSLSADLEDVATPRKKLAEDGSDKNKFILANELGGAAFAALFQHRFQDAINWSNEALQLIASTDPAYDPEERAELVFVYGNLAHGLLFTGKYEKALKIYRAHWDKPLGKRTFGDAIVEDFARFAKAGLTHPDLPRMKKALGVSPTAK